MKVLQTLVLMLTFMNIFACRGNGQTVKLADNSVKPVESPDSKPKVKIGEQFTLKMHESAKVEGADIEITLNRIGRKWLANGGGESLDFDFSVKHDGKIENYSHLPLTLITVGDYKIEVVKTEPFGDGYAIFVVTKNDSVKKNAADEAAAKFFESFGWHLDETVPPTEIPIEFPKTFDGIPFYHYQLASKNSGVDMTPMLGKKAAILKYTLKEKQSEQGEDFTIYAHLIVENGKVVGAWRTDSSSSEPGIYSFDKK